MADNYLERRFEEHRNGAAPQSKRAAKPAKVRKVCVVGVQTPLGLAVVRSLRVAGHNVAFCGSESEASRALAGSTGTSFTAVDVADAEALFQYSVS